MKLDIQELATILLNSGTSVGCLVYFMWYNAKYTEKNNELLNELKALIQVIYDRLGKDKEDN